MKFFNSYKQVIAILEQSNGNESVGSMWLDTKAFAKETPISEIIKWAGRDRYGTGKLIITINEPELTEDVTF